MTEGQALSDACLTARAVLAWDAQGRRRPEREGFFRELVALRVHTAAVDAGTIPGDCGWQDFTSEGRS